MVTIRFRRANPGVVASAGELWIRSAAGDRRDLATLVVEEGLNGLLHGDGALTTIVVSEDPTLDDMIALELARCALQGESPPPGIQEFCRYAALVREGLHPGTVPLERSLEGLYLALRNDLPAPLSDPAGQDAFLASWGRLRSAIWRAASEGKDPFAGTALTGNDFVRELTYLAGDRQTFKQDVLRGERLIVSIPGGPSEASALWLDEPRSLLFKSWSRSDPDALLGSGTNLFLAVRFSPGQWVFSTDPVQRLSLLELAEQLQAEEQARSPATAAVDPWFDGKPFRHTLVAAPRQGSKISDARIDELVRSWAKARAPSAAPETPTLPPTAPRRHLGAWQLLGAAAVLVALGLAARSSVATREAAWWQEGQVVPRGSRLTRQSRERLKADALQRPRFALLVAVSREVDALRLPRLTATVPDTARLYTLLRDRYGYRPEDVWLLSDEHVPLQGAAPAHIGSATRNDVLDAIRELQAATDRHQDSTFLFYFAGHGAVEEAAADIGQLVLSGYDPKDTLRTGYEMSRLSEDFAERLRSQHQLLLLDCCYSGFAVERGEPPDVGHIYELWKKRAQVVVTAATKDQRAYENQRLGTSHFMRALLFGLGEGLPADVPIDEQTDGIVTDDEVFAFLRRQLRSQTPLRARRRSAADSLEDVGQFLFIPASGGP